MSEFTPEQKALFERNVSYLINPYQRLALLNLSSSKFKPISDGGDVLSLNFIHISGKRVHQNPILELKERLEIFNKEFLLYPVLYFYGFGNGVLFKTLLKNSHLKHLIVFEDELEILYLAFHFLDFSEDLEGKRLMIFDSHINESNLAILLTDPRIFTFLRTYTLHITSAFYEGFESEILKLNENITRAIKNNIAALGNSSEDAFEGITQFVANLVPMLTQPSFETLLKERKSKAQTALIVSTGPSLTKQLPLLKAHQDKFSIICADSAYSILAQHDIRPDYVVMLERTAITSELIKKAHANIDEGALFVLLFLVHPSAVRYLEESGRRFVLAPYNDEFSSQFKFFDPKFSLAQGTTVAYNAFFLAIYLEHKNIIFIGQDLAYGEGGASHPKGYIYGEHYDAQFYPEKESAPAYGGKGVVWTHGLWNKFRYMLEIGIENARLAFELSIYNATEGGARIAGTEEKPFLWCVENLCDESLKKPFPPLTLQSVEEQNAQLCQAWRNLADILRQCEDFIAFFEDFNPAFALKFAKLKLVQNDKDFMREVMGDCDRAKERLDAFSKSAVKAFYHSILHNFELNLAQILVFNPQNEAQWWEKNLLFITQHLEFFQILPATVAKFKEGLEQNAHALKLELERRGLKSPF
ncbi:motility associated factor glycosyltransferase family protein [Campylobacter sp.]|uniref:motility associated factor glycosyltransferase family protein n=1 Tax=Campylobacter sp. TaxID=205 RepID=UPI0026DDA526|nr:motility associated factor glycosyltransferase family protein [Campylobacter sp.]MDO4673739.1 motility associated factor glycosyltransferase family protein [Campylobacter sp.]